MAGLIQDTRTQWGFSKTRAEPVGPAGCPPLRPPFATGPAGYPHDFQNRLLVSGHQSEVSVQKTTIVYYFFEIVDVTVANL